MQSYMTKTKYDAVNDILYIKMTTNPIASYGEEKEDGVVVLRSIENDEITGLMVYYPKRDRTKRESQLSKIGFPMKLQPLIR